MNRNSFIDLRLPCLAIVALSFCISAFFLMLWLTASSPDWRELAALSMKANTGFSLCSAAVALFLLGCPGGEWKQNWRPLALLFALIPLCLGAASILEYWLQTNLGIDELLAYDVRNEESSLYPGRMSPIAAAGIFLLGVSILLNFARGRLVDELQQLISVVVILMSAFALTGYIMGVSALYKVGPFIRISKYTAICLILLSFAGLSVKSSSSLYRILTSSGPGGMMVRRLLPMAIFFPPLIGYLRLLGQRLGYYDISQGTSISVITYMSLFSGLILWSGRTLNRESKQRRAAEEKFLYDLEFHAKSLERAVQARDEFLSIASHELKTPLTSLKMQVQMQKRQMQKRGEAAEPQTASFFENADRQMSRLNRLIDDMLDIGRIESGKFNLSREEFDLAALVREVTSQMAAEAHAGEISFHLDVPASLGIVADRVRMAQVLTNLLSNARKYGGSHPIEVSLREESGKVILAVKDQGPGIEPKDQRRIFERFERAVPGTKVSGLGLGLFIVKKIATQHQGEVSVQSVPGQGATFRVELPRQAPDS